MPDALHEKWATSLRKRSGTVSLKYLIRSRARAAVEQVQQAVAIAQATDFVDTIGYDGAVAQGGANLSG